MSGCCIYQSRFYMYQKYMLLACIAMLRIMSFSCPFPILILQVVTATPSLQSDACNVSSFPYSVLYLNAYTWWFLNVPKKRIYLVVSECTKSNSTCFRVFSC
ncbi:hypothetical protein F5890DRAFT_1514213 [Lentinula detonsa]|uniref:Uncharacterized protein n=1 Tax=Lentinula detonsa TaxID=2804962 RepID=A0AA38Q127_9AGAR|nr:hypothetical protein F5890DRAFT_1514213 [Lentinula detonsa]